MLHSNKVVKNHKGKKGKVDNLYRGSKRSDRCRTATTILPLFIGLHAIGCHKRCVDMKALARYQLTVYCLVKQRHIGVNNLSKVIARECSGRELNPRPLDHESDMLATTPPSHKRRSFSDHNNINHHHSDIAWM